MERFQEQFQTKAPGKDARYLVYELSRSILHVYEQRKRKLEAVAGNAIALITPNMLTSFANRIGKKHYPMALRQDDIIRK